MRVERRALQRHYGSCSALHDLIFPTQTWFNDCCWPHHICFMYGHVVQLWAATVCFAFELCFSVSVQDSCLLCCKDVHWTNELIQEQKLDFSITPLQLQASTGPHSVLIISEYDGTIRTCDFFFSVLTCSWNFIATNIPINFVTRLFFFFWKAASKDVLHRVFLK